jgi:hypothetical protein
VGATQRSRGQEADSPAPCEVGPHWSAAATVHRMRAGYARALAGGIQACS